MIAKRKDSLYSPGKRTKDWAAIRNLMDDDYLVCSYVSNAEFVASLVPGQYDHSGRIVYKRRVTLGKSSEDVDLIEKQPEVKNTLFQKAARICRRYHLDQAATGLQGRFHGPEP